MKASFLVTIIILILAGGISYLYTANIREFDLFDQKELINSVDSTETISPISPISVKYLRNLNFQAEKYEIVEKLSNGVNYERYLVSYLSEGEKVFALLTIPLQETPQGGFPAIIFNHGYIAPKTYSTTANYASYVDYLARNGFIVLKIDMRGHGNSEGLATGSYFSSTYTKDVLYALRSLQKSEIVNPKRIGIWGHSMSGNLVLRSMLISEEIKAGVIWAGAVYSYKDFGKYRISDSSYTARSMQQIAQSPNRDTNPEIQKLREDIDSVDFSSNYWKEISLTQNINYLKNPIQIHHSINDDVVNIGYSRDLELVLNENNKEYEYYEYPGGGHNITGIYFNQAMERTVEFFRKNL